MAVPIAAFRARCRWPVAGRVRIDLRPPQAPALRHLHRAERHRDRGARRDARWRRCTRARWCSPTSSAATGSWWCVDHGDKHHTLYAHLGEARVQPGQRVAAGEMVGTVGASSLEGPGPLLRDVRRRGPRPQDSAWSGWIADGTSSVHERGIRPAAGAACPYTRRHEPSRAASSSPSPPPCLVGYVALGSAPGARARRHDLRPARPLQRGRAHRPRGLRRAGERGPRHGGARLGLTDALDGDSAYLDAEEFRAYQAARRRTDAEIGVILLPAACRS